MQQQFGGRAAMKAGAAVVAWGFAVLGVVSAAQAAPVASLSPQGEVAQVRQVVVRFSEPVVPLGNLQQPAPYTLACEGGVPEGSARWLNERSWVYDFYEVLPAGRRCTLSLNPAFQASAAPGGQWQGPREHRFSSGAPVVTSVLPSPGSRIEEDQHFLLRLNGAINTASLPKAVWCEMEGLLDRLPVVVVEGAPRAAVLARHRISGAAQAQAVLLRCPRPLVAEAKLRLVWGPGVASAAVAGQPPLVVRREQRFEWQVRPRFMADFRCERENAKAACLPLRPMRLLFNSPVPRAAALAVRLVPEGGQPLLPTVEGEGQAEWVDSLRFGVPLPENTRFQLQLPAALKDEAGRALANAGAYPLAVATAGLPPLAKFAGAPFGIIESSRDPKQPALMPLTLRHVQADLAGASTGGRVALKRLGPETPDVELLRWLVRLRRDNEQQYETRSQSLLAAETGVQRSELPQLQGSTPAATEVLGVPLPQRGYHLIEVESRILGQALLAQRAPMYARTGALVTNLSVHFKRGRSSSLVWVSTLDRARPVPNARVAINDCRGRPLWNGSTDAQGMARVPRGFETEYAQDCLSQEGLFVTARAGSAGDEDLAFVFSEWARGIEPWRFNIPTGSGEKPDAVAHTVFDRTLLRVGETVSMKHFLRLATESSLALPPREQLPTELVLRHVGSGDEQLLPLAWPRGARSSESRWAIPATARLGLYDVELRRGDQRWLSGSFRVEAFRVPLVDARLSGPSGALVAPAELAFAAQLNALAGGPMAAAPLQLSALLQTAEPSFPAYDDFSFAPPEARSGSEGEDESTRRGGATLVADKLPASTDARGAARLVVKGLPALRGPADLQAELNFTDPNGEVQTVAQRLRLWPAAVVVGLRVPRWASLRADDSGAAQASATAVVLSTDGQPLKGRQVEVLGRVQQSYSTRKRIVGGFYAYDQHRSVKELGVLCSGKTDSLGRMACHFKLQAEGEVLLVARAQDDAGRSSEAAESVWVAGRGDWWFEQDNDDRIDVLPEKRELEPGQTARLQVRMPFRQATALVTVEREGVLDARVVQLSGREPVVEVPIPADANRSWAPNVVVGVLVLRGRLREAPWWSLFTWGWREPGEWWRAFRYEGQDWRAPSSMVDLAKPSFKFGAAALQVGRAQHKLDVKVVADKAQYAVRETVQATVQVSHQGRPLAGAEVAFAAVDEGLLALQANSSWELLDGLLQTRPWGVATATAQGEIVGRRHYGRKALPPGGGGGRNPTRELFDTLLLWRGSVQLDAQGRAQIAVPLNDSLTSFRLVAIADAPGEPGGELPRFGTGATSVRVSQDLQMLSGLPPLAREGDRFDAGFTLRNTTTRPMTVKATLAGQAAGAAALPALPPQTLNLAAGAAVEVRWPVQVPAGATRLEWQGAAEESGGSAAARDRLKIVQAVVPAVPLRVQQATLVQLQGSLSLPLAPPPDALPGSGGVQVALQPRLGGALPGLRRYFEAYPYTCLEQQTSRTLALRDEAGWARLREQAAGYLDADGLAFYFPPAAGSEARGSDRLTAYLLAAAHEAGRSWPDATRDAMLAGLTAFVEGRLQRRFNAPRADLDVRKLAALEALARHGRVQPRWLDSLSWAPAAWPTAALLDAWSLYRRGEALPQRAARLEELQALVRSRLVAGGTTLKFSTEVEDDWWWLMDGPDANAVRLLLAALDQPAWQAELPALLNGTLARQRGGAWLTTTANLWGVLALERFAAKFEATPVAGRSTLQLGPTTRTQDWAAAPAGSTQNLPWAGNAPLQAQHQGAGRPWLAVQALAAVPLRAPVAAGYRLTRSVTPVQQKTPGRWQRGDVLRVRVEIEALADMAWVVVSDPVPTGAALLGGGLGRDSALATQGEQRSGSAWPTFEERGFDAWRAYYEWLPRGRHRVEYTLRLNTSGQFQLPPTRVEAMYAPESFGESPNAALEVLP